jgi:UDP-glucose:(heptosyl)LPS alpha-1,3-glucosyltransferase
MKIALVRKNYTPYGGAENYLRLIAGRLSDQGHEIEIFSASDGFDDRFRLRKVSACKKPSFMSNLSFAAKSKEALQKVSPDFIISFERTYYQDIFRAGDGCHKEWLRKRAVIEPVIKQLSFKVNPHHLLLLEMERRCFNSSRAIIANSKMVKNDIIRNYSISPDKIHVIYKGVDTEVFQPVKNDVKKALRASCQFREENILLFIGADFKRKGVMPLLKAFALLESKSVRLIVAGRRASSEYVTMTEKLGIDKRVTFWGPEKEIKKLYGMADVFVLPTIYDPFSNATIEAMATGLPVITTQHNGASEIIEDGVQGYIVGPLDVALLAHRIDAALADSEEMGRNARVRAEDYPVENAVNAIAGLVSGM